MSNVYTSNWTEERLEQLKEMWTQGFSASWIAATLGSVSRNAVIGKAFRLGLEKRKENSNAKLYTNAELIEKRLQKNARKRELRRNRNAELAIPTRPNKRHAWETTFNKDHSQTAAPTHINLAHVGVISLKPIGWDKLNEHSCRWPLWDDAAPHSEQVFCGNNRHEGGYPYCINHCRVAYYKPR